MAFISSSSYIYQETFGVSSQVYSFFFAIFAVGLAIGPLIYMGSRGAGGAPRSSPAASG